MRKVDPCILDTLEFSGLDEAEMRRRALASREGLDLFEHELSFVRRRVVSRDVALPSLIILPDGPATIESYDGFIEALSSTFNIAIIEIPGFGFSYPLSPKALEFDEMSMIVAAAIKDLDMPTAVLVGPCFPGLIAARVAELIPNHLSGMIIAQVSDIQEMITWNGDVLNAQGFLTRPFEGQIIFRKIRERSTVDWWTPLVAGPNLNLNHFQAEARTVLQANCCCALASVLQKMEDMNLKTTFRSTVPTKILWGLADRSHDKTDKLKVKDMIPQATYAEYEDLGHFLDIEDPMVIAKTAFELLAS